MSGENLVSAIVFKLVSCASNSGILPHVGSARIATMMLGTTTKKLLTSIFVVCKN